MMTIKGLKSIAGESKGLDGRGQYLQINYNRNTGEAWADYFVSLGENSWKVYDDEDVVVCGNISEQKTMNEIRAMVEGAVRKADAREKI